MSSYLDGDDDMEFEMKYGNNFDSTGGNFPGGYIIAI